MNIHWAYVGFMFFRYILFAAACAVGATFLNAMILQGWTHEFLVSLSILEGFYIMAPCFVIYMLWKVGKNV